MTTYLTRDLLQELQPLCGTITSVTQFESKCSNSKSRREEAETNKNTDGKVHFLIIHNTSASSWDLWRSKVVEC